jgi:hypothetical protein
VTLSIQSVAVLAHLGLWLGWDAPRVSQRLLVEGVLSSTMILLQLILVWLLNVTGRARLER